MQNSDRTVVAADFSKIGRSTFAEIQDLKEIDLIVTDDNVDAAYISKLKAKGVKVVVS